MSKKVPKQRKERSFLRQLKQTVSTAKSLMKETIIRDKQTPSICGKPILIAYKGKRPVRRYVRIAGQKLTPLARFLWEQAHPNDPVRPGEEVHHKDFNSLNDTLSNFEKLTEFEHKLIHRKKTENDKANRNLAIRIAADIRNAIEGRKLRSESDYDQDFDRPALALLG